ncbi:MAG: PIN domain-containing protein [Bacteroidota bacterium]
MFDTNVVLDLLLAREPHARDAALAIDAAERGVVEGYVSAHAVTTVFYIVRKARAAEGAVRPSDDAYAAIRSLMDILHVAPITKAEVLAAIATAVPDFEDGITAEAAKACSAEAVVTRDKTGFDGTGMRTATPRALLSGLTGSDP